MILMLFNWQNEHDSALMKIDMFKMTKRQAYTAYKNYLNKMAEEWDSDPMIINLV